MKIHNCVLTGASVMVLLTLQTQATSLLVNDFGVGGWYSDDTRADGTGTMLAGTNLVSPTLTDDPEATATGNAANDADIHKQIQFLPAAALPTPAPLGTNQGGALHLSIEPGTGAGGKSQVSVRDNFGAGNAVFTTSLDIDYTWLGVGVSSISAGFKIGVQTSDFGSTGTSTRTGENAWDKIVIYEPGQGNGIFSDGAWHTEAIDYANGKWWVFDRKTFGSSQSNPMTLATMSTSLLEISSGKTMADIFALISAPGAVVSSIQFGIGSNNPGGDVYVNELTANFVNGGDTISFVPEPSIALGGILCIVGLGIRRRGR